MKSVIDKIKGRAIYAFLVLMVIFFTIINPNFLTVKNLLNVAKQVSIFGIASVGMTYVILLGGIDLQPDRLFLLLTLFVHILW